MANGTKIIIFENQKIEVPADATDDEIKVVLETLPEKNLYNAPLETLERSGKQFVKDVITPFTQPVKTANSIWELGKSLKNLLFVEGEQENEQIAKQVGEFLKERYGGIENIKKTFRTDPVGFVADLSLIVSGGAFLPARVPGAVGQMSRAVGGAGRVIDPIVASTKLATSKPFKIKGKSYGPGTLLTGLGETLARGYGWTTGQGPKFIKTAYGSTYAGGDKAASFSAGRTSDVNRINKIKTDLFNELTKVRKEYRTRWNNTSGKKLLNVKVSANEVNAILKNIEKTNKREGRWISYLDEALYNNLTNIKKSIFSSTKRRNGAGVDAYIDEINNLLSKDPNNPILLDLKNDMQNIIIKQMPEYKDLTKGFDKIRESERAIHTITSSGDADKIFKEVIDVLSETTDRPALSEAVTAVDKSRGLNLSEVAAGARGKGYWPTSPNLVTQQIKMQGFDLGGGLKNFFGALPTGGPFSPFFSPQVVGRKMKRAGEIARYAPKPLVNALRGNRALQQTEEDEVYY